MEKSKWELRFANQISVAYDIFMSEIFSRRHLFFSDLQVWHSYLSRHYIWFTNIRQTYTLVSLCHYASLGFLYNQKDSLTIKCEFKNVET